MKRLLFIAAALLWAQSAFAAYTYNRAISIQSMQVTGTHSNFTVLVCANMTLGNGNACPTVAGLNQSGGGAHVQNASGYDIGFSSSSSCSPLLNWEPPEIYTAATGALLTRVKVASFSNSSVIYICYGDAGISTFQGGAEGAAWDTNYKIVTHGGDGSTVSLLDASGNNNDGTDSSLEALAAVLSGGFTTAAAPAETGSISGTSSIVTGSALTISTLIKEVTHGGSASGGTFGKWDTMTYDWMFYYSLGTGHYFFFLQTSNGAVNIDSAVDASATAWAHLVGTYDGTNMRFYINGNQVATDTAQTGTIQNGGSSRVGWGEYLQTATTSFDFDESRVYAGTWSADYIKADDNQLTPNSFLSFGAEMSGGGGGPAAGSMLLSGVGK